ncbi:hypothetical protein QQF64_032142 [Cirrhinus molitorella]|uniref:Uncharacterized protein n=1 Tax=Cirrhinus molitorella TaxID=172907 RepID=A0ABR3MYY5_9TELE
MRGAMAQQSDRSEMINGESVCPAAPPDSRKDLEAAEVSVVATVSQQVDVASPNQSAAFTGHSSVSQSVSRSGRSEFEQRCAAVRFSIHSRADRGEGAAARRGGGADRPPPPEPGRPMAGEQREQKGHHT